MEKLQRYKSKYKESGVSIKKDIIKFTTSYKYFVLTTDQIKYLGDKYNVDVEDIFQYAIKIEKTLWLFESLNTLINGMIRAKRED